MPLYGRDDQAVTVFVVADGRLLFLRAGDHAERTHIGTLSGSAADSSLPLGTTTTGPVIH
jgi:hypothetical protein